MNRRAFLVFGATAAACAACAGCPDATFALAKDEEKSIDLGLLSELPDQAVVEKWSDKGFFLVRNDDKLYALSSECTHKKVRLTVKGSQLKCAKHGSAFQLSGELTKGPAKKSLVRYAICTDDRGHVLVDRARTFTKDNADDSAAFIAIAKAD